MNTTLILVVIALVLFSGLLANSRVLSRLERVVDRMENATVVVASDLVVAQHAVDEVAADLSTAKGVVETVALDLALSQHRADQVTAGSPGEAADAGAQSGIK